MFALLEKPLHHGQLINAAATTDIKKEGRRKEERRKKEGRRKEARE